jgi:hypothetical protein
MSLLSNMWSKLARNPSEPDAHIVIPAARVVGDTEHGDAKFVPHASYFEIRLKQMFLADQREYTREFTPLSSFNTEFSFAGQRVQTPVVVGPAMLGSIEVAKGDHLEFLNTRLIGPCPYEGDDIELFAGLFRMTTNDWAKRALALLEVLSTTFDTSKLSSTLNLAEPLVSGVEGFFGMQDIEFRFGKHQSFAAPGTGGGNQGTLQPQYLALLRLPRSKLGNDGAAKFWVRDGRLAWGDDAAHLQEFSGCDFMLLHIAPLSSRSDFGSFEFHRRYWRKIEDLLAEQKYDEAYETFRLLAANLVQCEDIVRSHRMALLRQYRQWIDDSAAEYQSLLGAPARGPTMRSAPPIRPQSGAVKLADRLRNGGPKRGEQSKPPGGSRSPSSGPIGEAELGAAVASADAAELAPERMFASLFDD